MNSKSTGHQTAAGRRRALVALVLLGCAVVGGCVHRRFTVRTNPPGARLYVDDYEIGTTPVSHDFVYYGTRKIRLVKDGYETLTILQPIPTPWYDLPGIDFFTENLIPYEFNDHRVLDFQMQPEVIVPTEQVLSHADELRRLKNPAVPGAVPPGAAPGSAPPGAMGPPAGVPAGAIPSTLSPGAPPSGNLPPGTPPPSWAPPSAGSPGTVPQYAVPPAAAPPSGAPQYGAPAYSTPPGAANLGAPAGGPTTLPTSPPAWPTTPPPSVTVPPATSGPPSNYRPPGY